MGRIVGYIPPKQAEKPVEVVRETPKAEKPKKETAKKEK